MVRGSGGARQHGASDDIADSEDDSRDRARAAEAARRTGPEGADDRPPDGRAGAG
jgi:hypothetical protein